MESCVFLPTSSDTDRLRTFSCSCQGPSMYARHCVYEALKDMFDKNPVALPQQVATILPNQPLLLDHSTMTCKCTIDYSYLTVRLLQAISARNRASADTMDYHSQEVKNLLYYFYR